MSAARDLLDQLEARPDDWVKQVFAMYSEGCSDREVMVELKLTPYQWKTLMDDLVESQFSEIIELGRTLAHAWWERQGRINLHSKTFNTGLYTIQMKNRFGWSEKTEQSMTTIDFENKDADELIREIRHLNSKLDAGRGKTSV